jgi:hypothetical protein
MTRFRGRVSLSGSVKLAVRVDGKASGLQLVLRFRRDLALWTLGQQPEYAKVNRSRVPLSGRLVPADCGRACVKHPSKITLTGHFTQVNTKAVNRAIVQAVYSPGDGRPTSLNDMTRRRPSLRLFQKTRIKTRISGSTTVTTERRKTFT